MKFVLRKAGKPGVFTKAPPKPKTGPIPFDIRATPVRSGGPEAVIEDLKKAGLGTHLFPRLTKCSVAQNGIAAYVPPINKLTFQYNPTTRRSDLLMHYVQQVLPSFAQEHPHIEICVVRTEGKPTISALYNNGKVKSIETGRKDLEGILRSVEELAYQKGYEGKEFKAPVISNNPGPAPIWDPFHSDLLFRP